ncbi:hypothetical protein ACJX0J_027813, partial [Zea mays]
MRRAKMSEHGGEKQTSVKNRVGPNSTSEAHFSNNKSEFICAFIAKMLHVDTIHAYIQIDFILVVLVFLISIAAGKTATTKKFLFLPLLLITQFLHDSMLIVAILGIPQKLALFSIESALFGGTDLHDPHPFFLVGFQQMEQAYNQLVHLDQEGNPQATNDFPVENEVPL